jgi:putative ABC transport system substrate-binding protein
VVRLPDYAAELVAAEPDVMFINGTPALWPHERQPAAYPSYLCKWPTLSAPAWWQALRVRVVILQALPIMRPAWGGKWLELLKEVAPHVVRVLVLFNPNNAGALGLLHAIHSAAGSLSVQVMTAPVNGMAVFGPLHLAIRPPLIPLKIAMLVWVHHRW